MGGWVVCIVRLDGWCGNFGIHHSRPAHQGLWVVVCAPVVVAVVVGTRWGSLLFASLLIVYDTFGFRSTITSPPHPAPLQEPAWGGVIGMEKMYFADQVRADVRAVVRAVDVCEWVGWRVGGWVGGWLAGRSQSRQPAAPKFENTLTNPFSLTHTATLPSPCTKQIREIRMRGGDVIVSFGGAAGQELAQVAADEDALVRATAWGSGCGGLWMVWCCLAKANQTDPLQACFHPPTY